jgi:ribonuclease T2
LPGGASLKPFLRGLHSFIFALTLALAGGVELGGATLAGAQTSSQSGCILDHCADRPGAPAPFDFYVLALSWSPSFCAERGERGGRQCEAGSDLGFVVHGLWPQNEHGFPHDCDAGSMRTPSRLALSDADGLYPDEGLARYEWRKHGACTGLAPSAFFATVRRARDAVHIPQNFQAPRASQMLAPIAVERAFVAANPRLRPGMIAVECRRGMMEDVRICMTKDLRDFRPCPDVARSTCRAGTISVPPVR